jgi:hypothetical protein
VTLLPIILIAALFFANLVAFLDWDYRRVEAKCEAKAKAMRAASLAAIPGRVAWLNKLADDLAARGQMIDARTARTNAARLIAKLA